MFAVELVDISKRFGQVIANRAVTLSVARGEVHCLLGENGAGKTTLMKILFGLYRADSGSMRVHGKQVEIRRPNDAIALGIGMVHQHFMLVPRLTVTENVVAGSEVLRNGFLDMKTAAENVAKLADRYRLKISPQSRVEDISVGQQQRVEILKALYRNADILVLDEPTAVLTPQETDDLFEVIRRLKNDGRTVIFITHKLRETMAISDRVTVLRDGSVVDTVVTAKTSPGELARRMVGREVLLRVERPPGNTAERLLEVSGLTVAPRHGSGVDSVTFSVRAGEILGIAGVEGNGQLELEEAIAGLRPIASGTMQVKGKPLGAGTNSRRAVGVAHIPSDRLRRGVIPEFSVARNLILGSQWRAPFARRGVLTNAEVTRYAIEITREYGIRCDGVDAPVDSLSGGNQQKLVVAREFSRNPDVVIACQPTRGVDVGAIEYIHNRLLDMRKNGKAVLLISAELDEVRTLCDRILVMYEGRIIAERGADCSESELGLLMAGHTPEAP